MQLTGTTLFVAGQFLVCFLSHGRDLGLLHMPSQIMKSEAILGSDILLNVGNQMGLNGDGQTL
jgi:hypothetical protein